MKKHDALLSIIIPAIRSDVELRRCVDSVRIACDSANNTYEIILVMPASQLQLARSMLEGVTHIIPESRRGIYSAMNDGIKASCGDFLYFLGKDDIVLPTFKDVLDGLSGANISGAVFDVYWGRGGVYSGRPSKFKVLYKNLCHQGVVYSRRVIDKHGPYLRRLKVQADHLLNIRFLWDKDLSKDIHYFPGGRVWYSADGFSSVESDLLFRRLLPIIVRRYAGKFLYKLLLIWRWLKGVR